MAVTDDSVTEEKEAKLLMGEKGNQAMNERKDLMEEKGEQEEKKRMFSTEEKGDEHESTSDEKLTIWEFLREGHERPLPQPEPTLTLERLVRTALEKFFTSYTPTESITSVTLSGNNGAHDFSFTAHYPYVSAFALTDLSVYFLCPLIDVSMCCRFSNKIFVLRLTITLNMNIGK